MSPATRGTQRFCSNCGAKVTKTQKFCPSCGEALQPPAEATEELAAPAAPTRKSAAARTKKLPPPPPPSAAAVPPPPPRARSEAGDLDWPAWLGAGAAGVLVIATGLPWFGGFISADGFDVPLSLLFSDTAQGGLPIGVLFVLAAAAGLGVALLKPEAPTLSVAFLSAGGAASFFMLWYLIRVLTSLEGASLFDVFSIGAWLALFASIAMLVSGVMLRQGSGRAPA